ncbi:hypothetical protein [Comamonas kerstersii]|uniref:hypothetical protein n=1 Tax=Comamonas kerstersii TaxID=225992 RepID=UPI0013B05B6F|nr:hypothetical protein [Comamonas kerstersii]
MPAAGGTSDIHSFSSVNRYFLFIAIGINQACAVLTVAQDSALVHVCLHGVVSGYKQSFIAQKHSNASKPGNISRCMICNVLKAQYLLG